MTIISLNESSFINLNTSLQEKINETSSKNDLNDIDDEMFQGFY